MGRYSMSYTVDRHPTRINPGQVNALHSHRPQPFIRADMKLYRTLRAILKHPFNQGRTPEALLRWLRWQIGSRIAPGRVLVPWINGTRLLAQTGDAGLTGSIYCGLYDYEEMVFLLHYLRPEDLFLDVGANAGVYTVLAAGAAGARAMSFEPVPATYAKLADNIAVNNLKERAKAHNMGVGSRQETLRFTTANGPSNRVMENDDGNTPTQSVNVDTLDAMLEGESPAAMKMDIEGFEYHALTGAVETLAKTSLSAIVIELKGHAEKFGSSDAEIDALIRESGFAPCHYDVATRTLTPVTDGSRRGGNVLYIRNLEHVRQRLAESAPVSHLGRTL